MSTEKTIETEVVTPAENTEAEVNEVEKTETTEDAEVSESKTKAEPKEEVWPKKAQNAVSRYKKEMNKARAEMKALQQQVQQFEARLQQPQKVDSAPKEADFETVLDYLKAESAYEARKAAEEYYSKQTKQTSEQTAQQRFIEQRGAHIAEKEETLAKEIPDLREVIEDSDDLYHLPPEIKELLITADNPSLAAYNLIKEGKIGSLAYMRPQLAAAEIVRAQSNMPQVRRPSTAPQPMRGLNGGGSGSKALTEMSPSELMKWVNQKR